MGIGYWALGIVVAHLGLMRVPSLLNSEALPWLYLYSIAPCCIAKMRCFVAAVSS